MAQEALVELVLCLIVNQSLSQWEEAAVVAVVEIQVHHLLVVQVAVLVVIMLSLFNQEEQEELSVIMVHHLNLHVLSEEAEVERVQRLHLQMVETENKFQ